MKSKPHSGILTRLTMLVVMIAATLTLSAQQLSIRPTISADKATPVTNNTLNALQGSGSISFTLEYNDLVREVSNATITINGVSHNIEYNVDAESHNVTFQPYTLTFDDVATYADIQASITYIGFSDYFLEEGRTITASYPNSIRVWERPSISFEGPTPEWGLLSGGTAVLKVNATGGNGWGYRWSTGETTSSINYTATNDSSGSREDQVTVRATNVAPDGTSVWEEVDHTFTVIVYPEANLSIHPVTPSEVVFAGTTVNFSVDPIGGLPGGWTYSWTGTSTSDGTTATYIAENTGSTAVKHTASVTATNSSPDGDMLWQYSPDFTVTVWPTAGAGLNAPVRTEWTNGETLTLEAELTGGNPSKWTYRWDVDGTAITNNSTTLNYTVNNGTPDGAKHRITFTATNTPDGIDAPQVVTRSYEYTAYPSPAISSLVCDNNIVFSGKPIQITAEVSGGKPDGWSYRWTSSETGDQVLGDAATIEVTPVNTGTGRKTITYYLSAANVCGFNEIVRTIDVSVEVWPTPEMTLDTPEVTEWFNDNTVTLNAVTKGGDPNHWVYTWRVDGQVVAGGASFNYTAINTGTEPVTRTITVEANNWPQDMKEPAIITRTYTCTVYPSPEITSLTVDNNVIYSGETVNATAQVAGGNPDGWRYEWTIDNIAAVDFKGLTLHDSPVNNGTSSMTRTYLIKAINTCGNKELILTREVAVTVWPSPTATLNAPARTEWINGESVPLNIASTGGDAANWTYTWKVDGQTVTENSANYNYLAFNNSSTAANRTITVTATNAPQGIAHPYTTTLTYECIVYGTPSIAAHTIDKPVIYSGTNVTMAATVSGGKPEGWTYSWTVDGTTMSGSEPNVTVAPYNTGTQSVQHVYRLTATNTCDASVNTFTQDYTVTVWPIASATLVKPDNTEWYSGSDISLDVTTAGGDPDKWTYTWNYPGATSNSKSLTFNAVNTGNTTLNQTVTLIATNTPDGIDAPYTVTYTYDYILFPEPKLSLMTIDRPVIFSGDSYTMGITAVGGKPEGWTYSWTRNGVAIGNTTSSLSDSPVNTGSTADHYAYEVTATNTCDGETVILSHTFNTTVWPAAVADMVTPTRTEWINGETLPFSVDFHGGDTDSWSYKWTVDGQTIAETSSAFSYIANNTGATGVRRTITVTATNAPQGIAAPYTYSQTYECTVYGTPSIANYTIDKPVIFSGTNVTMAATVSGGKPQGWVYSWTVDGNPMNGNEPTVTVAPNNTGNGSEQHVYRLTATNSCDETVNTLTQDFTVTVWPVATANLNTPSRVEWINGETLPFSVETNGGDTDNWSFSWTVDGQPAAVTTPSFDYIANNTGLTGVRRTISVTATNTPQGIAAPYTYTQTYNCTVYPTPVITAITIDKPVTYSGTPVTMSITTQGGLPQGWVYTWTKNGNPINGTTTLIDNPVNTGTGSATYTYAVQAVNTLDDQVNTFSETFTVTVWPTPTATLADNLPDDVISGDVITLPVTLGGGDSNAWNIKWSVDGTEVQSGTSTTFDFTAINTNENESRNSVVTVDITNAPEGIDRAFTANYSHTFIVWPGPTAISLLDNFQVTCAGRSLTLGVNYIGGQASNWTFEWTRNGSPIANTAATLPVTFANSGSTMISDTYTVTSTNTVEGEVRYKNTETYAINIYPAPITSQGRKTWDAYYDNDVNLEVTPAGGYPQGWKYRWSDNLPDSPSVSYTIPGSSEDSYTKTVTLTVTNGYGDTVWSSDTYTFDITCWSRGTVTAATSPEANYNGNIDMTLSAISRSGYPQGWTYEWYLNGNFQADGQPSLAINETNYNETVVNHTWMLVATNTLEGVIGSRTEISFNYALWPVIEAPTSFEVSRSNMSNSSTVVLSVAPQAASGGYQYKWNYDWTANGTPVGSNDPVITVTASISDNNSMAYEDIVYGLRLTNPAPESGFWFDQTYANRTVRVYNRPSTPTALQRKGNGTTCTMIALTDMTDAQLTANDYTFVFGYTDASGVDHAMPATADRFCRFTSDIYNNRSNDFWVYASWNYTNGVTVTSNRRHLNGDIDDYDGSNYDTTGRGDSAGFDSIVVDDDDIYVDARGFKVNLTTASEATVRIINTAGNVVFMNQYPASDSFSETFDKATLVPGVYIVTVEAGTTVKIKKIVIK